MSEEKLYAVKDDEGKYLLMVMDSGSCWEEDAGTATKSRNLALAWAKNNGGRVFTLVEEPVKVVVSPEEAKLVKNCLWTNLQDAFLNNINLLFRGRRPEDITRLKSALTNGYTVAKDKKYNVKVPHAEGWHFQKYSSASKLGVRNNWRPFPAKDIDSNMSKDLFIFTESEIEHYGLQDCEKEEVTDDGIR
ncbi:MULTISPECIES: DUF1642 domain-containing protein [Lacticaseibacillus]|uniref:Hypothetical phage protein n=1 Tax=Lacticaseibacillus casei DSM 20011 = JCM 1134 = ATCC 393 TaxID=1423732 RepID=A0AAD1AMF3_LACCA|nr:DUF1642 domain-containing protein [Lacticaseibacillus casei]MBI6598634.1 DUF1642 domain-containing protein [Lacticaseibacillus casei]MBO1482306.1 DUF1642 domain-containing protein [Lacticaseibacillus casei]MBO2417759.1 DUF1642 domain-containing protein [Lacticaseibacillus casei]MCK2081946.1 DUF1642 domain-containing protein [Lacticaseibacillus casei]MED7631862.1 DUF1642 domain-containing protein [Lacticaseibacillus casei]